MGRSKQLIPADSNSANLIREVISPCKQNEQTASNNNTVGLNDLAVHMANARREYHQNSSSTLSAAVRRRSNTVSPKNNIIKVKPVDRTASDSEFCITPTHKKGEDGLSRAAMSSLLSKDSEYLRKNKRLSDVSRKMDALKERTKSKFAEIEQITAKCNKIAPVNLPDPTDQMCAPSEIPALQHTTTRDKSSLEIDNNIVDGNNSSSTAIATEVAVPSSSGAIKKIIDSPLNAVSTEKFIKKDRISFKDMDSDLVTPAVASHRRPDHVSVSFFKDRKRSASAEENFSDASLGIIDRSPAPQSDTSPKKKTSLDASSDVYLLATPKKSQNFRRKSSEENSATNHIVSILKKKDHNESSSASSNASPVTFSSSVVDTPTRSASRQGILKKRSSLDESRYSRSHSPDERSILVRTPRRNSLEEIQHIGGILKQRSYEGKSEYSSTSNEPHGILKKKETSTPSDQSTYPKHVSISEAVILAAAELCKDAIGSDGEHGDIRPILKQDTPTISTPRPILKKKYSSETEEIRPILKTSRKSSRDESDIDTDSYRSILRIDSPAKRRSFGTDPFETNIVLERSRSYDVEYQDCGGKQPALRNDAQAGPVAVQQPIIEKPLVSVAERIKNMEQALSSVSIPLANVALRRPRFKTQPVTVEEINW